MTIATFAIGGMHCAACAIRNERTLLKTPGVEKASVNLGTRRARVEFDDTVVAEAALHEAVIDNGYEVLDEQSVDLQQLARDEVRTGRWRALAAIVLAAPVVVLAMSDVALPWSYLGRNASTWIEAILSTIVILGLGRDFPSGNADADPQPRSQHGHPDLARDPGSAPIQPVGNVDGWISISTSRPVL